jgi:RNA polymerase sigma-54 factor
MLNQVQQLGQKQLLKLSPQQIQLLNFIQLNALELDQKIKDELEENPCLELEAPATTDEEASAEAEPESEAPRDDYSDDPFAILDQYHQDDDIPDYKTTMEYRGVDTDERYSAPAVERKDFREQLKDQLLMMNLPRREMLLSGYIIDSLDDDGYLRHDLGDLADTLSFAQGLFVEEAELESALELVQTLEPAGIGARDLRECLMLQLEGKRVSTEGVDIAWTIVDRYLADLGNRNYEKILHVIGCSTEQLRQAIAVIERLSPKPVTTSVSELAESQNIIPEFIIEKDDSGDITVQLTNKSTAELRLNSEMMEMLEALSHDRGNKQNKAAAQYLRSKVNSALWFIDAIKQRENSMLRTIQTIVRFQREYFLSGDYKKLKPMILKDVAERTGLDISTISRVTSTKYALTDFGIVHLKELFTNGLMKEDGELASNKEIRDIIIDLINGEDKKNPITDQEISDILQKTGYVVARRTVAKYRDSLNIPVAKMRRGL